ncbi:long-chain-acyl-CoA synthetase [Haliangium sp.]|uniref:long-chain-acyl-CoA synthetase n=1 Tax=Haliangium sp. TaxID=2663208 RepID=UPI003D0D7348
MKRDDRLTWRDIGRGVLTLSKKIRPGTRALADLALLRDQRRMSLGKALERSADRYPEAVCIKHEGGEIDYRSFNARANRIAHHLAASGVGRGDAVAILLDNRPELLEVVAAVVKLGGVAALLNTQQRRQVLLHSLACFEPRLYVIGEELVDAFEEIRPQLEAAPGPERVRYVRDQGVHPAPSGYLDLGHASASQPEGNPNTTDDVRLSDRCFYIFTSGTTGLPKASILSHKRWLMAAAGFGGACLELGPGQTVYAPLPLYHNLGLTVAWGGAVHTGAALAIRRHFSAGAFWDDCRRYHADAFVYIGEIPRYLLNRDPDPRDREHPVRRILGVGLRPELWLAFKRRFGIREIYEIYASSEMNTSFLNVMNLDRTVGFSPGRWAIVAFDVDAGEPVRDRRGRLVRVRKGEVGLLITKVSKRFSFDGYTDRRASEHKLLRDVFRAGDQWFDSGDLMRDIGYGHLQFVDRVGDTFRWKSENVATSEVEQVLAGFEGVADCTVYGVEVPGMPGRAGMAAVVPSDPSKTLDAAALLAHLERELPGYAVPVFLRIAAELERTGTFKHRKLALREAGYDPGKTNDPLFVHLPGNDAYTRVTSAIYAQIQRRAFRF